MTADADVLERLMRTRFSCRGFLREEVDEATVERMLSMAQRSASWCNAQPWRVIVTRGEATDRFRAALAGSSAGSSDIPFPLDYRGVYRERRRQTALQLYAAVGVAMGDREASARQAAENFKLFGAPHVAVVTTEGALGSYGVMDCGAWVAGFQLAGASLGVACIAQASIAARGAAVRAHFAIGDDRKIVCAVSFGRADPAHPANTFRTERAAVTDVADHHR